MHEIHSTSSRYGAYASRHPMTQRGYIGSTHRDGQRLAAPVASHQLGDAKDATGGRQQPFRPTNALGSRVHR